MKTREEKRIGANIYLDQYNKLKKHAKEIDLSFGGLIRRILDEYIQREVK